MIDSDIVDEKLTDMSLSVLWSFLTLLMFIFITWSTLDTRNAIVISLFVYTIYTIIMAMAAASHNRSLSDCKVAFRNTLAVLLEIEKSRATTPEQNTNKNPFEAADELLNKTQNLSFNKRLGYIDSIAAAFIPKLMQALIEIFILICAAYIGAKCRSEMSWIIQLIDKLIS